MNAPWLFAPPEAWSDDRVVLPPDESHHALRVLRSAPGDEVVVIDGAGTVARSTVVGEIAGRLELQVIESRRERPPVPEVVLLQGVAKRSKVDEVVERAAELGVSEVGVFESERSVASWDRAKAEKLEARWAGIARSAAKVARSGFVMRSRSGMAFADLVATVTREPLTVVLWEEATVPLRSMLPDGAARVTLVVGPEGGLAAAEVEALTAAGALAASLGPRILRTETAGAVAAAAVMFRYGVLG